MRSARFRSSVVGAGMGAVAVLAACSEAPTQAADPPVARPDASIAPVMVADAQRLSAGVRAAMARSLTAALDELDLEPAAPMRLLHEFLDGVESQRIQRLGTAAGPARTIDR
jgi:hypothetical protein